MPSSDEASPTTMDVINQTNGLASMPLDGSTSINQHERSRQIRVLVVLLLVISLTFVIVDSFGDRKIEAAILNFLEWVEEHPDEGVLAVICVYIVATILFVPGSILTLGTGYAFGSACDNTAYGVFLASTAVFVGASLGSICAFLLGRYLFRDCVVQLAASYPMFRAVDRALQGNGLKIMILLRLSPLIPYNALDYMSGVTAIPLWSYTLALIGILPGTIMFCFVGASASSLTDSATSGSKTVKIVSIVSGVVFAFCGVYAASYYSKLELDRILTEDAVESDPGHSASIPLRGRNLSDSPEDTSYQGGDGEAGIPSERTGGSEIDGFVLS